MTSGDVIRKIREERGLSRWAFGLMLINAKIITSNSQVKLWEESDSVKLSKVKQLCKFLGENPMRFFED